MRLRRLKTWEIGMGRKYVIAHPDSELGDPNFADERGLDLVAIKPNGFMVYRRRPWWRA